MVNHTLFLLTIGFLCLGNPEYFKSEKSEGPQIFAFCLRGTSILLKKTVFDIFQDYFAIEQRNAEAREGTKKEDVDLESDIGVLTGNTHSLVTDEYVLFPLFLIFFRTSFFLVGNYLSDIISNALSADPALASAATEVLEAVARGGLGAPVDVCLVNDFLILVLSYACGS
jgi:hypothetical protein